MNPCVQPLPSTLALNPCLIPHPEPSRDLKQKWEARQKLRESQLPDARCEPDTFEVGESVVIRSEKVGDGMYHLSSLRQKQNSDIPPFIKHLSITPALSRLLYIKPSITLMLVSHLSTFKGTLSGTCYIHYMTYCTRILVCSPHALSKVPKCVKLKGSTAKNFSKNHCTTDIPDNQLYHKKIYKHAPD